MSAPFENDHSTNGLSVWLDLRWNTNNAVFTAPARIDMLGYVWLQPRPHAGDVVRVDFFADGKRLGSGKAVWHDEIRPPPGALYLFGPPPAQPMHIVAAQFDPAEFVWQDVPAGIYTLTATATWTDGVISSSGPLKATVLP